MLNATWLETFTTLCEVGHFTRTAERLNMTQPGVSKHLRKLEEQVGQPLIAQQGKSFTLTPAGEAVMTLGQSRRAEERRLRDLIDHDDPDTGAVSVACSGSFALMLYPQILRVLGAAPALSVQLEAAPQSNVLAGVLDGRFDLGILARDPAHPRLDARRIGQEELCLVLPRDAAWQRVTLEGLQARGLIAHPDVAAYADDLLGLNFPDTYPGADHLRLRSHVNQIGQIPDPVASGIGYTLLPRSGVEAHPRRAQVHISPLPRRRHHELWIITQRARPLSARITRIAALAERVAAGLADSG